jgi:hypothetical protein
MSCHAYEDDSTKCFNKWNFLSWNLFSISHFMKIPQEFHSIISISPSSICRKQVSCIYVIAQYHVYLIVHAISILNSEQLRKIDFNENYAMQWVWVHLFNSCFIFIQKIYFLHYFETSRIFFKNIKFHFTKK